MVTLSKLFSIPSWEEFYDDNVDYILENSEDGDEVAQDYLTDNLARAWDAGVQACVKQFQERFNLMLIQRDNGKHEVMAVNWENSLEAIRETINGVGYFQFDSNEDMIESGPFDDAKDCVLKHLHWTRDYGDVYGDESPSYLFDKTVSRYFRSM